MESEFGRKRKINLNSCNKDFTCLDGFCPSFVTVEGATLRKEGIAKDPETIVRLKADLPIPDLPVLDRPWDLLVTGVGGTGVVTVGQLIAMAANLEGKGASVLDFMGFAQKFGPVLSYIRLSRSDRDVNQARIEPCSADALIGCDLVVSTSPKASATYRADRTKAVVNTAVMPTGDLVQNRDADLNITARLEELRTGVDAAALKALDANALAEALMGDTVFANVLMLGAAWQAGLVPLGEAALMRAMDLNGVKPDQNKDAFTWGRIIAHVPDTVAQIAGIAAAPAGTLDEMIDRRAAFLTDYQDASWADQFRTAIAAVREAETQVAGAPGALTEAAARGLFKLMSYKDEYEVARLHTETGFIEGLKGRFEGEFTVRHHLAPPFIPGKRDARGRPLKRAFGPWVRSGFRLLARMKRLRGTRWDVFGHTAERRMERALIAEYRELLEDLCAGLRPETLAEAARIAGLVMEIRGFGPVKEAAATKVRASIAEAMAAYRDA